MWLHSGSWVASCFSIILSISHHKTIETFRHSLSDLLRPNNNIDQAGSWWTSHAVGSLIMLCHTLAEFLCMFHLWNSWNLCHLCLLLGLMEFLERDSEEPSIKPPVWGHSLMDSTDVSAAGCPYWPMSLNRLTPGTRQGAVKVQKHLRLFGVSFHWWAI